MLTEDQINFLLSKEYKNYEGASSFFFGCK